MNNTFNKLSIGWIALWLLTNIAVGVISYFSGWVLMALAAYVLFPFTHYLLLSIQFGFGRSLWWLLFYLLVPFLYIFEFLLEFPWLVISISIVFVEILLYLISNKFGRFVFSFIAFLGAIMVYGLGFNRFFLGLEKIQQVSIIFFSDSAIFGNWH